MQESFLQIYSSRSFHIDTEESSGRISESSLLPSSNLYFRGVWGKHTQFLFPFHWGVSTNASLNLNLSLCRSWVVTLHHPEQLVSPGLEFANERRFPPFLTKGRAFLAFSVYAKGEIEKQVRERGSAHHAINKGQQYLTPHETQRFT